MSTSNKIDSNITGLAYAEEASLKTLAVTPVWYGLEPNSYSDFGGELSTVSRAPIDPSRQNKKGTVTDMDASGGFNTDFTKNNLYRLLQGFIFADAREMPSTAPLNGTPAVITGVTGTGYSLASGGTRFSVGQLLHATGFPLPSNNGLKLVKAATTTEIQAEPSTAVGGTSSTAKLECVGFEFPEDDAVLTSEQNVVTLATTTTPMSSVPNLFPGKWVFLGGDAQVNRFSATGYARISSVGEKSITFDDVTWPVGVNDNGDGKKIRIFTGNAIRNEKDPALIKRRSYHIERTLGEQNGLTQGEYLIGAVANEFTLNIPQADKLNADVTFVACDNKYFDGTSNSPRLPGTRVSSPGEDAYNTSLDVYRVKMHVHSQTSSPESLFGYVTEANVSINNNVTPNKAVGVLGAFDTSAGNFEVSGSITAYFSTVAAVQAVRNNADVGMSVIGAAKNGGFVFDIPLLGLGGGRANVEKDAPITVPLEPAGAENSNGYTLLYQQFSYLPQIAMPE